MDKIKQLRETIKNNNQIVFFGGAGVSTESGIPDFRSADGLYRQEYRYPPEQIISHSFFYSHPSEFYEFYRAKMIFPDAKPNKAHLALAKLEQEGKLLGVITQNIDGLHQMAGSKHVMELHGSVYRNYCQKCGKFYEVTAITQTRGVPKCSCGGTIKPDVVLYEESLDEATIYQSVQWLRQAEVLIIGGTSLAVYPAAGLINYYQGNHLILINKSPTPMDDRADLLIEGSIGEVLDQAVNIETIAD
ncbi:NAD-dependent protein deacylase [Youxingia wuxianensis]|uniref:NAD-dependent protein deacetylase n=1 Tax=Youxingia wuxianensis TaxID=2763678 RepID=A0A926EMY2_9FIRM|nr:NAD-dependent protein deacylase [Youxingia wuxianensis]MBC8586443.1 NAD-dependent protein deacylase [Youxingia wuxianensis]